MTQCHALAADVQAGFCSEDVLSVYPIGRTRQKFHRTPGRSA